MPEKTPVNVFWFRRDLRLEDNHGLSQALKDNLPVLALFIFDPNILGHLEDQNDARVAFIHSRLETINHQIKRYSGNLTVLYATPKEAFLQLTRRYQLNSVYCNHDYEPYAQQRDGEVEQFLEGHGIGFQSFKDQVIFEKDEVVKADKTPYTVFTPYKRKWLERFDQHHIASYEIPGDPGFIHQTHFPNPSLSDLGFEKNTKIQVPSSSIDLDIIRSYQETRDFPALKGTTRLGVHLRFGTISIRRLVRMAKESNHTYLSELIWREFYMMILWHYPHVIHSAFKPAYDLIEWRNDPQEFELWKQGKTGYPLVDAGMRELNQTGYMHNRVRMVTASFLCKHLLIDWKWGEAYFAQKLLDFELSSNNGGWQWAAGTGCDAAPYFRVFNPTLQAQKFDRQLLYIKKWVPELHLPIYPSPIVDHALARKRAIDTYKNVLKPVA